MPPSASQPYHSVVPPNPGTPAPPLAVPFFFNDTATTEIYALSLHDALPIFSPPWSGAVTTSEPRSDAANAAPLESAVAPSRTVQPAGIPDKVAIGRAHV